MSETIHEFGFDLGFDLTFVLECPNYAIIEANALATDTLGLGALPLSAERVIHPEDLLRMRLVVEPLLRRGETWSGQMRIQRADGSLTELRATLSARSTANDATVATIAVSARDAAEGSPLLAELAYRATHDPLTALPNRALLLDRLGLALARSRRQQTPTAVIFIDLDRFKSINDELGHGRGDDVLRSAAQQMRIALRPSDTIARLGGDEFVAVCSEINDPQQAMTIAYRLAGVLALCETEGDPLKASIGVAVSLDGEVSVEEIINDADVAMYEAKRRGRDQIVEFTPSLTDSAPVDKPARPESDNDLSLQAATGKTDSAEPSGESDASSAASIDGGGISAARSFLRGSGVSGGPSQRENADITDADLVAASGDGPDFELRFDPVIDLTNGQTVQVAVHPHDPSTGKRSLLDGHVEEVIDRCVDMATELFGTSGAEAPALSIDVDQHAVARTFRHVSQHVAPNLELAADALCIELSDEVVRTLSSAQLSDVHEFASSGVPLTISRFHRTAPTVGQFASVAARLVKIDPTLVAELDAQHSGRAIDRVAELIAVAAQAEVALVAAGVSTSEQVQLLLDLGCMYAQGPLFGTRLRRARLDSFLEKPVAAFG